MRLSQEQVEQYHRDGFLVLEGLLSETEVGTLRQRVEDIAAGRVPFPEEGLEYEPGAKEHRRNIDNLRKINSCAEHDPFFLQHARNPAILEVVEALLGQDIKFFGDQLFMKPPGGMEKTYHQDSAYFNIDPMALVSSWVALDDVTIENGCMWVVPGSHRDGLVDHSEAWMVGDREDKHVPDSAFDRGKETAITMRMGGCSFHHSLLLHRSGPNLTPHRRRGLATHYMTARSRWTGEPGAKPDYPLLRGRDYEGCV